MSVTHPNASFAPAPQQGFVDKHPQLAPFLVAMAVFVLSAATALAITGLPG